MYERSKKDFLLTGFKKSFMYSLAAAGILSLIAIFYSLIRSREVFQNIFLSFYYFSAFTLILAVPQLYKRNEDAELRKVRTKSFFKAFESPYEEEAAIESFKEYKGDGFWLGIFIVVFTLFLFFYGFVLENIYYMMRG